MSEQKQKLSVFKAVSYFGLATVVLVIASVITWIWVGDVQVKCGHRIEKYSNGYSDSGANDWYCRNGSAEESATWSLVYGTLWKLCITMTIISVIAWPVAFFRG